MADLLESDPALSALGTLGDYIDSLYKSVTAPISSDEAPAKSTGKLKAGAPSLAELMKTTINGADMKNLAAHPDFPLLAQDTGIQQLVAGLTNQVGKVLSGYNGNSGN